MRRSFMLLFVVVVGLAALFVAVPLVEAETIQSNNYKIDESSIGTSGPLNASSGSYGITDATGDIGVGNSKSSSYQINAGSKTTANPALSFSVDTSGSDFGVLSTTEASTATAHFSVVNYTTYGYVVQIFGSTPTNDSYVIPGMSTLGGSVPGTEQYGINLVANTSPVSFGENPDNGQFGFGSITSNYSTANQFYYEDGDIIARADQDSGLTNYTISFLVNVASLTPGGIYAADQTLVVVGTY